MRALHSSLALLVLLTVLAPLCAAQEEGAPEINPVLVVMDVQNEWMPRMAEEDKASAPAKINEAIELFRELELPVIRVYHSSPENGPDVGTEAFEFIDSIAVTEDDPKIVKQHPSAFTKTGLEDMLREEGHDTVILCGLSATGCVLATYYGAMDREFMVLMVEDALLSGNAEHTNFIEEICYSVSVDKMREIWAAEEQAPNE
jgi:nicotinamidase-related amidase